MKLAMIVAMDLDRVIGRDGELPWHLPADLKYFKATTMGKPIIMGRVTHESIGRALPGRRNIVLTQRSGYRADGCEVVNSVEEALDRAQPAEEAMVIGGAQIYELFLPRCDRLYLTRVHDHVGGDTRFPEFDEHQWSETVREDHEPDAKNSYGYSFLLWERQSS